MNTKAKKKNSATVARIFLVRLQTNLVLVFFATHVPALLFFPPKTSDIVETSLRSNLDNFAHPPCSIYGGGSPHGVFSFLLINHIM